MPYLSPVLNVMVAAARKAGRPLIRDFGELENLQISHKGPADFVSNADERTERILMEELSRTRPGYGFFGEETGSHEGSDKSHRFIIDPIDGTTNFLHGVPAFAVSVALERDGQLVTALVYNPVTDEMFVAEKGHGAYLNDKRLRVATRKSLSETLVATGIPFLGRATGEERTRSLAEVEAVVSRTSGIRRFGSAALDLAYVAAGRFDAFWERDLHAWDIAAGVLLVREAGGVVTNLDGSLDPLKNGDVLAANEVLHPQLLRILKNPQPLA
jgi:myo-inositol-1(or 4)-monophosphatase